MPYNHDIHNLAPLPSGPLPTEQELNELNRRCRQRQAETVFRFLRRLFRR